MNNEEKILEILGYIQSDVSGLKTDVADLKSDVADLRDRVVKIEVTQENIVLPQLQALAEGQANLLATLAPKNRVEALEDEMAFMKSVIKALSQEVAELKKAQ
ncbi:hypothetical protein OBV_19740 [Oscillibacter valericigenes Sjm18-20]|nr:hypothetical protein OBV_19740 [Oscillibacter valericigenes Sjm18-20]